MGTARTIRNRSFRWFAAGLAALLLQSVGVAEPKPAATNVTKPADLPTTSDGQHQGGSAEQKTAAPPGSNSLTPPAKPAFLMVPITPKLNLAPQNQFPMTGLTLRNGKSPEHRSHGLSLGNDADWKVQTLQIGAMVGAFGALSWLCGTGACRLPVGDVLPDFLQTDMSYPDRTIRESTSIRDAR